MRWRDGRGFSLVELLVVIAVLGLLSALLLPALAGSRVRARQAVCASNLRQIGLALDQYQDEHHGAFPRTTHGAAHSNSWIFTMAPYLGNVDEIRISPGDPQAQARLAAGGSSYVMNEYVTVPLESFGGVEEDYTNIKLLSRPSRTFVTFIGADHLPAHVTADHTHSRAWPDGWQVLLADIQPDRFRVGSAASDHTRGSANYLYADAHVAAIEGGALAALHKDEPDFARPPQD